MTFNDLNVHYPKKDFRLSMTKSRLDLVSPDVFGLSMNGGRFEFAIHISARDKPLVPTLSAVLGHDTFKELFPDLTEKSFHPVSEFVTRSAIAGMCGYRRTMGIEGTNTQSDILALSPTRTLVIDVDYATDFANPKIKMSGDDQLRLAESIIATITTTP